MGVTASCANRSEVLSTVTTHSDVVFEVANPPRIDGVNVYSPSTSALTLTLTGTIDQVCALSLDASDLLGIAA